MRIKHGFGLLLLLVLCSFQVFSLELQQNGNSTNAYGDWIVGADATCGGAVSNTSHLTDDDYGTQAILVHADTSEAFFDVNYSFSRMPDVFLWETQTYEGGADVELRNQTVNGTCLNLTVMLRIRVYDYVGAGKRQNELFCYDYSAGSFVGVHNSSQGVCSPSYVFDDRVFFNLTCLSNVTNSSWSSWSSGVCVDHVMNTSRTRTEYDAGGCGVFVNVTHVESYLSDCECVGDFGDEFVIFGILAVLLAWFPMLFFKNYDPKWVVLTLLVCFALLFVVYGVVNLTSIC